MQRLSLCAFCRHLSRNQNREAICAAYPEGVPADFILGRKQHVRLAEGDHGIQFEAAEGQEKSPFVLYMLEVHRTTTPEQPSDTPASAG